MSREYFKTFHSYLKSIEPLNDAERGRLFTAMLEYSITGVAPHLSGNERFIFPTMKVNLDREIESYRNVVERNRENGKNGGRPKTQMDRENPVGFSKTQKTQDQQEKDKEKEKEKDEDKEREKNARARRFSPPSVEEVTLYCRERMNRVDPNRFVDFYSAKGWKIGSSPMKDWKAAVRTWEQREQTAYQQNGEQTSNPFLAIAREEGIL